MYLTNYVTASKMFVSGDNHFKPSLVLDFKTNEGCSKLPKSYFYLGSMMLWPADSGNYVTKGVGGMLGNISIFCASTNWQFHDDQNYFDLWDGCMIWKNNTWRRGPNMLTSRRSNPAGIVMQGKVWYTGGVTCYGYRYRDLAPTEEFGVEFRSRDNCSTMLKSTELISLKSTEPFVDMPKSLIAHCIIKINEDLAMVTGGRTESDEDPTRMTMYFEKSTHFFSFSNQRWLPGPDLSIGRHDHACGTFLMGDETIMAVAGGYRQLSVDEQRKTDSVEFLSLQNLDNGWFQGPKLPHFMALFPMLTSPNGKGLITIGGEIEADTGIEAFDGVFELKCDDEVLDNCSWLESPFNMTQIVGEAIKKEVRHRIHGGRYNHVAFWIPEELDMCQPKQDEDQESEE